MGLQHISLGLMIFGTPSSNGIFDLSYRAVKIDYPSFAH